MKKDSKPGHQAYSTAIVDLLKQNRIMPIGRGTPDKSIKQILERLTIEEAFAPGQIVDRESATLCLAGLWLFYNNLEECHHIAQEIETEEAAYWHAIMHRREGDFSNCKYWFRRVGEHPIFAALYSKAKNLVNNLKPDNSTSFLVKQSRWDPFAFVDVCEHCVKGRISAEDLCGQIQQVEWQLLFDYCCQKAIGR